MAEEGVCRVRVFAYDQSGNPVSDVSVLLEGQVLYTDSTGYTAYVVCPCESGLRTAEITPLDRCRCLEESGTIDYLCVEGDTTIKAALVCEVQGVGYVRGRVSDRDGNPVAGASIRIEGNDYITNDDGYTVYASCVCDDKLHTATITPPDDYECYRGKCESIYFCLEGFNTRKFSLEFVGVVVELALSEISTIRRHGSKFYLQGEISNIKETDELCLMYSRPGSADLLNLRSQIVDYTYLKGTSGTYRLESGEKYIEFSASGYYIFELWRVSGDCETRTEKVADSFLNLEAPKYQYQLYFDVDAPEIAGSRHLLQAEYDKYNDAKPWTVVAEGNDCFSRIVPSALYSGGGVFDAWLCQAGEFLASGCSPLPWWVCPSLTDWDIYMRGECSCSDFRENLQPLGIPCFHLIAAKAYYGDDPPYCPYKPCG